MLVDKSESGHWKKSRTYVPVNLFDGLRATARNVKTAHRILYRQVVLKQIKEDQIIGIGLVVSQVHHLSDLVGC